MRRQLDNINFCENKKRYLFYVFYFLPGYFLVQKMAFYSGKGIDVKRCWEITIGSISFLK